MENPEIIPPVAETTELDKTCRELIEEAEDWDSLFETLKQIDVVPGTGKNYFADKLISYIEKIKKGDMELEYLPRTYGLRDKVGKLLS